MTFYSTRVSNRQLLLISWSVVALAVGAVVLGAYLPSLAFPFVSDDGMYLAGNPQLLSLPASEWWRLFLEPFNGPKEFLPLRELSFWLDFKLFGLNPVAFRTHNIALFLLSLPLVFVLTARVWRHFMPAHAADARSVAIAVTALFAVNPVLVESVIWISGRKYVLANLLSFIALWYAMRSLREGGLAPRYAGIAIAIFAGVMLAKSSYVTVGQVVGLIWGSHWIASPQVRRWGLGLVWPAGLAAVAVGLLYLFISMGQVDVAESERLDRIGVAGSLAMLAWLIRLALGIEARHLYYPTFDVAYLELMVFAGALALVVVIYALWVLWHRRSVIAFSALAFFALCLPYLHLMPFGSPSAVQDRYLSLAIWPLIVGIVAATWRLSPAFRWACLVMLGTLWSGQTLIRAQDWRSFESLVDKDAAAFPGYFVPAYYKLVAVELPHGMYRNGIETASAVTRPETRQMMQNLVRAAYAVNVSAVTSGNPSAAMNSLWALGDEIKRRPLQARWHGPLALVWGDARNVVKGMWTNLVDHFPADSVLRYNWGLWLLRENLLADAELHLRVAVEAQDLPLNLRGIAYRNLGLAMLYQGKVAAAESPLLAALNHEPPDRRAYCGLVKVYRHAGDASRRQAAESACGRVPGGEVAR